MHALCDGIELLDSGQSCAFLGCSQDALRQAVTRKLLNPAKIGPLLVFTRRDLQRYKDREETYEITQQLNSGSHPLAIYLEARGRFTLEEVTDALHDWAKLTGAWVIEGPRGSFARWLDRLGLPRITPRELRRVIEVLLRDPATPTAAAVALATGPSNQVGSSNRRPLDAPATPSTPTTSPAKQRRQSDNRRNRRAG